MPYFLCPPAEAEGTIGPIAGSGASLRRSKPILQAFLQRLGIFPLRGGSAGISGDRGESPQPSPQRPERPVKPIVLHTAILTRLAASGVATRSAGHRRWSVMSRFECNSGAVIPGPSAGRNPESMNINFSKDFRGLC
ncbi:MAG: hypothetical protein AB7H90_23440 [Alphaproteobacteria bacterium]